MFYFSNSKGSLAFCLLLAAFVQSGCVSVVNEVSVKKMNFIELCASICELASLTQTPASEQSICPAPNPYVLARLAEKYPLWTPTKVELANISELPIENAAELAVEGISECAFLALFRLPSYGQYWPGLGAIYTYGNHTYYFPENAEAPHTRRTLALSSQTAFNRPFSEETQNGVLKKKKGDIYFQNHKIRRSDCVGAIVNGECHGAVIGPSNVGAKKCYGDVVMGSCIGSEF